MARSSDGPRYLWLLRHAKTLRDPPAGGADRDRQLAPRGEHDADALGKRLAGGGRRGLAELEGVPLPAVVLTSSATRAAQTAERVVGRLEHPPAIRYLDSLYAATPQEVLRQVKRVDDQVRAVMVVGHNPTAQALALELVQRRDRAGRKAVQRRSFETCAMAVYRFTVERWEQVSLGSATLAALVTPPY